MSPAYDEYGEVVTHELTIETIVNDIEMSGSAIIGWTDQAGTHLDVMFTTRPEVYGNLQRGMRQGDLFVSVSGHGMFGFNMNEHEKFPGYIGEKLNLGSTNTTTIALADLINSVIKELQS